MWELFVIQQQLTDTLCWIQLTLTAQIVLYCTYYPYAISLLSHWAGRGFLFSFFFLSTEPIPGTQCTLNVYLLVE